MPPIEHPVITEINETGYPLDKQPKHCGIDAMGDEIHEGDAIVQINNEVVLESNLEDFLIEHLGAVYCNAE